MLKKHATAAKKRAIQRHKVTENLTVTVNAKIMLTKVDPKVCPVSRAVLCIPPAAPVLDTGVAITITMLLGV